MDSSLPRVLLAISGDEKVYVADRNHRILVFESAGTFVHTWGSEGTGTGPGQFTSVDGLAISGDGQVYVTR